MLQNSYLELLRYLSRKTNDPHAAADLAQESITRVLTIQASGELISNARALLFRIANNLLTDQYRQRHIREHENIDTLEQADMPAIPSYQQPEEIMSATQTYQAYSQTIEALPPRCREAFILHVLDGLPQADVAEKMGISRSMVEKHIVRAILACRECARQLQQP